MASQPQPDQTPDTPARQEIEVPSSFIHVFTGELGFGVIKRDSTGDIAIMQMDCGIAGGGICRVEFPAAFTPQVITGLKAAFEDWCERDPEAGAEQAARARAAAAGIEVPVMQVPGAITSDQMRQREG